MTTGEKIKMLRVKKECRKKNSERKLGFKRLRSISMKREL